MSLLFVIDAGSVFLLPHVLEECTHFMQHSLFCYMHVESPHLKYTAESPHYPWSIVTRKMPPKINPLWLEIFCPQEVMEIWVIEDLVGVYSMFYKSYAHKLISWAGEWEEMSNACMHGSASPGKFVVYRCDPWKCEGF